MKQICQLFIVGLLVFSCQQPEKEISSINVINWQKRVIDLPASDSLISGETYLSVYSEIYSRTQHRTHDLTATISMRNMNHRDSVFITQAGYYNTSGDLIRTYFDKTIFLRPMETVEIIIDETDREGGTGANFIFEWKIRPNSFEPFFEGVMISTSGTQGLSFTTQGKRIN